MRALSEIPQPVQEESPDCGDNDGPQALGTGGIAVMCSDRGWYAGASSQRHRRRFPAGTNVSIRTSPDLRTLSRTCSHNRPGSHKKDQARTNEGSHATMCYRLQA
jgi:hypothetical protein